MLSRGRHLWILYGVIFGVGVGFRLSPSIYQYPLANHFALSGTFGELRGNHFHSGMDIKTHGKVGIPVQAIEQGYVHRLLVSPFGFGKAVYLRHPDGRYSVYAHLDRFPDAWEDLVYSRQMLNQSFRQDIYLAPDDLPVSQSMVIGYSGNSGSSLGPHLHFEIRDPDESIVNPLPYYQHLIRDTRPPVVKQIGFEPLAVHSRIEGAYQKHLLQPQGTNGDYRLPNLIQVNGPVGLEFEAFDRLDAAPNKCGINYVQLYLDGELHYDWSLQKFAFDETRYLNLHIDYVHYRKHKERLERVYVEPGNRFSGDQGNLQRGVIDLKDDRIHDFLLVLTDQHGNRSEVAGQLQRKAQENLPSTLTYYAVPKVNARQHRGNLVFEAVKPHSSYWNGLEVYFEDGSDSLLRPVYGNNGHLTFLLPISSGRFPLMVSDPVYQFEQNYDFQGTILPDEEKLVELEDVSLFFPRKVVYHPTPLQVSQHPREPGMYSDMFEVGELHQPLHDPYLINFALPENAPQDQLVVAQQVGNTWEYAGSTREEAGIVSAAMREFGRFCLMADQQAPSIRPLNFGDQGYVNQSMDRLRVAVGDDFSGLESGKLYGTVDGQWALWVYDYKAETLTWKLDRDRPTPGFHEIAIFVEDKAGNLTQKTYRLRF
ncbi:MAG: M23 family metallopeptidase [Bacteroidota bacterium]